MIINTQESDIQVVGDITEFKSSIDPKNLEFITTLLSSNLYSAPERSFIREIVSNAWDSQVEAGTTNIPIIIKITESKRTDYYGKDFTGYGDITIRDFGTGLSPERFNDIYRNIGSSTKRESNDYHGAFGIGHLSGFSCSNTIYITSYYEGTCYEYIGIKDANTIVYTLVSTTPTTEKNGLEVTLKNVYLDKYRKSLKYINFFPNVFIDDNNSFLKSLNDIKIKKYNNFWVSSWTIEDKLLLGNVLYPLNKVELNLDYSLKCFLETVQYTGIVFKFDIGELSVTPNRENIIYTKECVDKIIKKISAAKQEIDNLINEKAKEDFTDLVEYTKIITDDKCFDFFSEKICSYGSYMYKIPKNQATGLTYKNKYLVPYLDLLRLLMHNITYCSKYLICDARIYTVDRKIPFRYSKKFNLKNVIIEKTEILILKEDIKLGKYLKSYLLEKCSYSAYSDSCIILKPLDVNTLKTYIGVNSISVYSNTTDINFILQEFVDYIYSKGTVVDFNNDADFIKYKEECKEEAKLNRKNNTFKNEEVILNIYSYGYASALRRTCNNFSEAIEYLKNLHKGIVLIDRDATEYTKEIIVKRGFLPVFVNKKVREALKDYSFNVELDWVLNKDPYLSYYKTIIEVFEGESYINERLKALKEVISSNYLEDINNIMRVNASYHDNSIYGRQAKITGITDVSLKNRLLKIKGFLEKYEDTLTIMRDSGIATRYYDPDDKRFIGLIAKILVKSKSFIVNPTAYRSIKSNKLINILCKK